MADEGKTSPQELLFLQTISMFQVAAMQQMGKIMDPVSGKVSRDLEQAKISIDILDVLKEKTKGNLTATESEFLNKVLFELHMNYVDELKASKESPESESGAEEKVGAQGADAREDGVTGEGDERPGEAAKQAKPRKRKTKKKKEQQ